MAASEGIAVPVETEQPQAPLDLQPQIAHLLLIDVVGYSQLLVNEQIELLQELNRIVRNTEMFRAADAKDKLMRIPTGDGMALLFFDNPEQPVRCALEISAALKARPEIRVRMGIHSGPVNQVSDVNDRVNIAGAGINIAQRVLDCGDAGHIIVSKHVADDLMQSRQWHAYLHDLGECEVKHGLRLHIFNLCKDGLGNPQPPLKLLAPKQRRREHDSRRSASGHSGMLWRIVAATCATALLLTMSILWFRFLRSGPSRVSGAIPEKSIAVLPFDSFSDDTQNTYFADGVQDEILTALAKVADLKVISRTSTLQYRSANGTRRNLREIAEQLGVGSVVEGTVQRVGNRVRVSAQLIDAKNDNHLWAEHYDRDVADVFAVESEVAQNIVARLRAKLAPHERASLEERPTNDLVAFELYQRARDLVDSVGVGATDKQKLLQAVGLLEKATARDRQFLRAFYYLARAHDLLYFLGFDHTTARLQSAANAVQATVQLRPESGESHLAQGQHQYYAFRDYDRARAEFALAQKALPNESLIFRLLALLDRREGRWDTSIANINRAAELDPRNVSILQHLCFTYEVLRRYAEARQTADRMLAIAPDDLSARIMKADAEFLARGDLEPLRQAIETILRKQPQAAETIASSFLALGLRQHDVATAQAALRSLPADGCEYAGLPFPRAWCEGVVAQLGGNKVEAGAAFERARAELEPIVRQQPNYAEGLCVLGAIDAVLGNKTKAIAEGRRAVELCPINRDALQGALLVEMLGYIYAWTGEKELALDELERIAHMPGGPAYGDLLKHPYFDPLRGEPRFEKLVREMAPRPSP